jgi:hypothetical protein
MLHRWDSMATPVGSQRPSLRAIARFPRGELGDRDARWLVSRLSVALDDVSAWVRGFVVLSDDQLTAVALWVLHTYAIEAAEITPYLAITSAEKQSGKTVLLDVLDAIVLDPWRAVRPSEAVLFRKIEAQQPTLLLDEADTIWGPKAKSEDEGLRALLNAGYRKAGSTVPRCVGKSMELRDFSTYCAKALAGIGDLPDTVADRSIPIRMARKRRSDRVERFRWRTVKDDAEAMRAAVSDAIVPVICDLVDATPTLPDELSDRAQDGWECLLAIADLAGGDWPDRARGAAVALHADRIEEVPIGVRLLADVRHVMQEDEKRIPTTELLERLHGIDDAPWGEWRGKGLSARGLASLLRPYGIEPDRESSVRGYYRAQFADTWERYLVPCQAVTSVTPVISSVNDAPNEAVYERNDGYDGLWGNKNSPVVAS